MAENVKSMMKTLGFASEKGGAGALAKAKVHDAKRVRVRVIGKDQNNNTANNNGKVGSKVSSVKSISWAQMILAAFIVVIHVIFTM